MNLFKSKTLMFCTVVGLFWNCTKGGGSKGMFGNGRNDNSPTGTSQINQTSLSTGGHYVSTTASSSNPVTTKSNSNPKKSVSTQSSKNGIVKYPLTKSQDKTITRQSLWVVAYVMNIDKVKFDLEDIPKYINTGHEGIAKLIWTYTKEDTYMLYLRLSMKSSYPFFDTFDPSKIEKDKTFKYLSKYHPLFFRNDIEIYPSSNDMSFRKFKSLFRYSYGCNLEEADSKDTSVISLQEAKKICNEPKYMDKNTALLFKLCSKCIYRKPLLIPYSQFAASYLHQSTHLDLRECLSTCMLDFALYLESKYKYKETASYEHDIQAVYDGQTEVYLYNYFQGKDIK